jgi:BNR repeat-like domain
MSRGRRHVLDVRALPGTLERVACRDGGLFPVLAPADGGAIAVLRGGAGHLGRSGRVELIRSPDRGATWTPPVVVADSEHDDRNPAVGRSRAGTLVIGYQRLGSYDRDGTYRPELRDADGSRPVEIVVTRSIDDGSSWETPVKVGVAPLATGSPFGKIATLSDGTLLMAIYAASDGGTMCSHVVRSTDDGATWVDPSLVARGMNETALCAFPGDEVLAVMRGADARQALFGTRSRDGGRSWTEPEPITGAHQHPADLVELAGGAVLLTYGNRAPPYRIEGLLSRDRGASWDECLLVFSGPEADAAEPARATDLGYPSTVIERSSGPARGITMYYDNPSLAGRAEERPHLRPPYPVRGYRAVAVSWSEEELIDAVERLCVRR